MTDVEKLKHQRRMLDQRIQAAERRELDARLRDVMRRLAGNGDLSFADILETSLQAWRDQPDTRHTVAGFLEILEAAVGVPPAAPCS